MLLTLKKISEILCKQIINIFPLDYIISVSINMEIIDGKLVLTPNVHISSSK